MAMRVQLLLIVTVSILLGALLFFFMVVPRRKQLAELEKTLQDAQSRLVSYRQQDNSIADVPDNWRLRLKNSIETFDSSFEHLDYDVPDYVRETYIHNKIRDLLRRATRSPQLGVLLFNLETVGGNFTERHNPDGELKSVEFSCMGQGDQNDVGLVLERLERDEVPPPPPDVEEVSKPEVARVLEYRIEHLGGGQVKLFVRVELLIGTQSK